MAPVSRGLVASVALTVILVLAGCTVTTGPMDGTDVTPGPTTTERVTTTEAAAEPPYDPDDPLLFVRILDGHYDSLRNASFTYERDQRTHVQGSGRWHRERRTLRAAPDDSVYWIDELNGSARFEVYRPGNGLQYERGPDRRTDEVGYNVHNYTDDMFVDTIRLGPRHAMIALSFVNHTASNVSYLGTRTVDGERLHAYGMSNSSATYSTEVTFLVTKRGVIRQATSRIEREYDAGTRITAATETYRAVNGTTVEPPEWLDEARAAEG